MIHVRVSGPSLKFKEKLTSEKAPIKIGKHICALFRAYFQVKNTEANGAEVNFAEVDFPGGEFCRGEFSRR